jgi:hypothetical protein
VSGAIFLEHDTTQKARRALVSACALSFLVQQLDLQSNHIVVLGLKMGVSHDKLIWFSLLAAGYFATVYAMRIVPEVPLRIALRRAELHSDEKVMVQKLQEMLHRFEKGKYLHEDTKEVLALLRGIGVTYRMNPVLGPLGYARLNVFCVDVFLPFAAVTLAFYPFFLTVI